MASVTARDGGGLFGFVEGGHGRAVAALFLLCLVLFVPGFSSLPPMDRDEPRFAQATSHGLQCVLPQVETAHRLQRHALVGEGEDVQAGQVHDRPCEIPPAFKGHGHGIVDRPTDRECLSKKAVRS